MQLKNLYREISNDPLIQLNETNKFIEAIDNKINKEKEEERKLVFEVQKNMNSGEIISINDNLCNNCNVDTINKDSYIITSNNNLIVKKEKNGSKKLIETFNCKRKEIVNNNNNSNNINNNNINISIQKQNNSFNDMKGKDNYDLEQWVNYIENDDKNKKSKKKKHKKSKNKNNEINKSLNKENESIENEIELIKISLLNNSCNKYSIRKLKPKISENWLMKYNCKNNI